MKKLTLVLSCLIFVSFAYGEIIESENFDSGWGSWSLENVLGSQEWDRNNTYGMGGTACAVMKGYDGGQHANEDWLISPPLNFNSYVAEKVSFWNACGYSGDDIAILISTDYSGSGNPNSANWTDLTSQATLSPGGDWTWYDSGEIDVSAYNGASVFIAFKYTSSDSSGKTWEIDDIEITGLDNEDPNLNMPDSIIFGGVNSGTINTQYLNVANIGTYSNLTIAGIFPISGDTNIFHVGTITNVLTPGASNNVEILYEPGSVSGAIYLATFQLICNDPSTPTNEITFSGFTLPLSISNVQYSVSGVSPFLNEEITLVGICTYSEATGANNDEAGYAISEPEGGAWNGIYINDIFHRPEYGEEIQVKGTVKEFNGLTRLESITEYLSLSKSNSVPAVTITAAELSTEPYESVLVSITNVTVSDENVGGNGYEWQIQDSSGTCLVDDRVPYRYIWKLGDTLTEIRGIGWYSYSAFKLAPRNDDDFVGRDVLEYALKGMIITPEGVKSNWYVHILDDDIVSVSSNAPSGVNIIDTEGIIFPGLIDAHNHPSWNSFPTLMFHDFPFGHRDEWGHSAEYSDWKSKRNVVKNYSSVNESSKGTVSKFAEVLELMGGCIAIQGNYSGKEYAHPDVMLFNVEQYPSKIFADIFSWTMNSSERTELAAQIAGGAINSAIIHLCEGPDATSHAQFTTWKNWGLLTKETAIIHGTSLVSNDFAEMAAVGAKLIWSPMSNMKLFDKTANPKLAHQLGVNVGISPDWTPSGCYNLLEELGYAWQLNQTEFDNYFTAKQMCDMVTINNAISCGIDNRYGKVEAGYNAGFCVISGDQSDPYMALINARPKDVKLTIIDGTPRYGDASLIEAIGATGETVNVWGTTKMLNIAFEHPFLDYSQETFATIRGNLQTAHATLNTSCSTGYLDTDELQFLDLDLLQKGPDNVPPFVGYSDNPILSPANGAQLTTGDPTQMSFFTNGFWDNLTRSADLIHKEIAIVPDNNPSSVQLIIATDLVNTPANKTVNFTPEFNGDDTNYIFRFITADGYNNATTTLFTDVKFTVIPEPTLIFSIFNFGFWIYYLKR